MRSLALSLSRSSDPRIDWITGDDIFGSWLAAICAPTYVRLVSLVLRESSGHVWAPHDHDPVSECLFQDASPPSFLLSQDGASGTRWFVGPFVFLHFPEPTTAHQQ